VWEVIDTAHTTVKIAKVEYIYIYIYIYYIIIYYVGRSNAREHQPHLRETKMWCQTCQMMRVLQRLKQRGIEQWCIGACQLRLGESCIIKWKYHTIIFPFQVTLKWHRKFVRHQVVSGYAGVYIMTWRKKGGTLWRRVLRPTPQCTQCTIRGKVHGAVRVGVGHVSTHTTPYDILTPFCSTGPWAPSPASRPGQVTPA